VAYALWRFVPLYHNQRCARLSWTITPRGPRLAQFLDAYGLKDRSGILATALRSQAVVATTIEAWAAASDPVFAGLRHEGRVAKIRGDMRYVERCGQCGRARAPVLPRTGALSAEARPRGAQLDACPLRQCSPSTSGFGRQAELERSLVTTLSTLDVHQVATTRGAKSATVSR
jgi:hypothetical protein